MASEPAVATARPAVGVHTVGAFQENCYLLTDTATAASVLVDPGAEPDRLIAAVERSGTTLEAIWLTHAHLDHVGAIAGLKRRWNVPVHLHPFDEPLYAMATRQALLIVPQLRQTEREQTGDQTRNPPRS